MSSGKVSARQPLKSKSKSKSSASKSRTSNSRELPPITRINWHNSCNLRPIRCLAPVVQSVVSRMRGNLYIVSAPSGSGKTTLLQHLLRSFKDLKFSVSYTTRQARTGERHGVDYFFTDRTAFNQMADRGEFLEWAEFNA